MKQTFHNRSGTDAEVIATLTAISQVSAESDFATDNDDDFLD